MLTEKLLSFTLLGAEWVLWLLLVLSVFSIGVMIDRIVMLILNAVDMDELTTNIQKLLKEKDWDGLKKLVSGRSVVHRVFNGALHYKDDGAGAVEEGTQAIILKERLRLEKNLTFLGTLGNNAPFIGLFGTVLGIIRAFSDLALNTSQGAAAVMAGISEALVATGVGLLVAIPAVIAYNFFNRRIKTLMINSEALVKLLIADMKADGKETNAQPPENKN